MEKGRARTGESGRIPVPWLAPPRFSFFHFPFSFFLPPYPNRFS